MSAKSESIVKSLLESIKSPSKETQPYDTSATVTRVEDDTVFVHIPGGVAETPCSKTISCKVGDTVQVRVGGGKAWLVGNASAPPTDDTTANTAIKRTAKLGDSLTKLQKIAGNTDQYFWHVETGEDTGSHITEIPKERFLEAPALGGGNLLLRSNGIAIRNGLNELATFSSSAIQFNQPGTSTVVATIGASGLYIQKGVIKLGNKTSATDTSNTGFYVDVNGNVAASNILITGGTIGGWTINASSLSQDDTHFVLNRTGLHMDNVYTDHEAHEWSASYGMYSFDVSCDGDYVMGRPTKIDIANNGGGQGTTITQTRFYSFKMSTVSDADYVDMYPGYMTLRRVNGNAYVHCVSAGSVGCQISLVATTAGDRGLYDDGTGNYVIRKDSSNNVHIPRPLYVENGDIFNSSGALHLGTGYNTNLHISCVWSDNNWHDIITRNGSSNDVYIGGANSLGFTTNTYIRGTNVKLQGASGSTITSDRNVKKDITAYDSKYDAFYDALNPVSYQFINGTSGRTHCGFISQDVRDALISSGLSTTEFGGYIREDIENREIDSDGQDVPLSNINYLLDHDINEIHELIYSEFIALNTWQIQKLKARMAELEARLNG